MKVCPVVGFGARVHTAPTGVQGDDELCYKMPIPNIKVDPFVEFHKKRISCALFPCTVLLSDSVAPLME